MRRNLTELGLAAMIFFAANTVYGIDAMLGHSLSSARDYTSADRGGHNNMHVRLAESQAMRLPSPVSVELTGSDTTYTLCVGPEFGRQAVAVSLLDRYRQLVSEDSSLPYTLDLAINNNVGSTLNESVTSASCEGAGNVTLNVSLGTDAAPLVRSQVFTDTVTLVVNPE